MNFRMDMLKKEIADKDYWCLWCREKIPKSDEYYKRKRKGFRYHVSCVEEATAKGQFDGLMLKEG
jgi:hypothetical protein